MQEGDAVEHSLHDYQNHIVAWFRKSNMSPLFIEQFLEMVIRFLAEGAASGLNVIAVYVAEILRVTGLNGRFQGRLRASQMLHGARCFSVCKSHLH